jgi:hypothetical protein
MALGIINCRNLFNVSQRRGLFAATEGRHSQRLMRLQRQTGIVGATREYEQIVGDFLGGL